MTDRSLGSVKLSTIKKAISQLEKQYSNSDNKEELKISFEYLIASFFPKVLDNIKRRMTMSYIEGYNAAWEEINSINKKDNINEDKRLN